MRIQDVPQRGSRGRVVASRNRFGQYQKERVDPAQPATDAQCAVWGNMAALSLLWDKLSPEQWLGWRRLAGQVRTRRVFGESGWLDGCLLFKKLNCVLATCRRTVLFDAPPLPEFGPNPVKGFEIREIGGQAAFKLIMSPKVQWETRSPLEDLMVFATPPRNAGVEKENRLFFIGLVSALVDGECDFTEPYLRKLKEWRKLGAKWYHLPLEGSRVFVRVCQQVNGWQDALGMFYASALVPDNWDGADRPKPAH